MITATQINWTDLGHQLRQSAENAHGKEHFPSVHVAYSFLLDNPECFDAFCDFDEETGPEWPEDMPQVPNVELIAAYYGAI